MNIKELLEEESKLQNRILEIKKLLAENKVYVVSRAYCRNESMRDIDTKVFKNYEKAKEYYISLAKQYEDGINDDFEYFNPDCCTFYASERTVLIEIRDIYIE